MATGFRDRIKDMSPAMFKDGVGEREMYCFGLALDVLNEKRCQALDARRPPYAQPDALLVLAGDRLITPGLTESATSLARRVQTAMEAWQLAGNVRAPLSQLLGYVLEKTPMVREVGTRFDPTTFPPTRLDSTWNTYPEGRSLTAEPVFTYCPSGGPGEWDWDSSSPITGSWGWWSSYVILYSVGAQAWIGQAGMWGAGSTYTPDPSGRYSGISVGAYVSLGSYAGTSRAWGAGTTYTPSSTGRYSKIANGKYEPAGLYQGDGNAWGVDAKVSVGLGIVAILTSFKAADVWIRVVAVSFSATLFDPAGSPGAENPDGLWGRWSKIQVNGTTLARYYINSRDTNSVYGGEIR